MRSIPTLLPNYLREQASLYRLDKARSKASPIWTPFVDTPQEAAYHSTADIIGYGGAAGGGKSDLALGKAFTQFYRSLILRREYSQTDGIIARGNDIQDGRCYFTAGDKKSWNTPDGRNIKVSGVEHANDIRKYKGRARDFIVFDEAADFLENMVRFILGWLRTDRMDIKPQALLCFNPPTTPEGEWIVKFFAPWIDSDYQGTKAQDGEIRWFIRTADDKDVEVESDAPVQVGERMYAPQSRTFFHASVEDNPIYMATGYDKQLEKLPEPLRSQMRWGNFNISAVDDIWQTIPTAWIVETQNRYIKIGKPDLALRSIGVDPSRGGGDAFAMAKLYGTYFEVHTEPGSLSPDGIIGARHVTDYMGDENAPVFVDVIGIGSSVYDHLKVLGGVRATPVNVAVASRAKDKTGRYGFANLRSEILWKFREALDPNSGEDIALPPDTELRNDLRAAKFSIVGGKIKVENKDDIRERIGRSPDKGDAVLLAWYGATSGLMPMPVFWDG
jgi:hypothetical protein